MIVITVAHHLEARYLSEALDLKQIRSISARPVFEGESLRVAVAGMGSINAAIATTLALSSLSADTPCAALNFGICCGRESHAVGELFQVNAISAAASHRHFYPDMILNLHLPQASLETRDQPYLADNSSALTTDLVDMEGAGFYEAARSFTSPERIFLLKVVSDHGQSFEQIRGSLPELIRQQTTVLRNTIRTIESWLISNREFESEQLQAISRIREQLQLTETQYQRLLFLCRARGKEGNLIDLLSPFLGQSYTHRQQRTHVFNEIVDALAIPLI